MSNQSYYSESFLSEETVVPGKQLIGKGIIILIVRKKNSENLKKELRNELESHKRDITRKIRFLQAELSDAKIEIAGLKGKNEELEDKIKGLENKAETHELKLDHFEKTLDEKIVENEMQRMTIDKEKKFGSDCKKTAFENCSSERKLRLERESTKSSV